MEVINITEEQRDKLCSELAKLTFEFRKDENIECIYFAPYKGLGEITGNVLEVTLVKDVCEDKDLDEKLKEYNSTYQKHDSIKEFGFQIFLETADTQKYTMMNLNPAESAKSNDLMNSTILYDNSGLFTRIKERVTKSFKENSSNIYYYYDNLAEVFPLLDDKTLYNALDDARAERDTAAVKEFTKTRLFQDIIDM